MNENGEPRVGIFWMVATPVGAKLLVASSPLSGAEPYGDCLTFGPGHYQVWNGWRRSRDLEAATRAVVRAHEYEVFPRGRIVFDRVQDRFMLYADQKLMGATALMQIFERFNLPEERTVVQGDSHYRSGESS